MKNGALKHDVVEESLPSLMVADEGFFDESDEASHADDRMELVHFVIELENNDHDNND